MVLAYAHRPDLPMTTASWILAALAAGFAVGDWCFVLTENKPARHVTKPAALAFLVGVAVTLEPAVSSGIRTAMVIGLVLSLAGDVFLLKERFFLFGLVSFLVGHIAYVVGLQMADTSLVGTLVGLAVVAASVVVVGRYFRPAIASGENPDVVAPGIAYAAVISAMVVSAFGTASLWAIVGGLLFYISDGTLAWNRFLERRRWGPLAVMITYHLGQAGLVAWLVWP